MYSKSTFKVNAFITYKTAVENEHSPVDKPDNLLTLKDGY